MASVYRDPRARKRGTHRPWCISYVGLEGRRHREKTDAATKVEAERLLRKKLTELTQARLIGAQSVESLKPRLFADFVEKEYLPHCKATHTPSTYRGDRGFARAVLPLFGSMPLRSITSGDVQRFVDRRAQRTSAFGRPVKPATVNRELMFISGVLSEAVKRGYLDRNAATGIAQLPEHNDRLRWLSRKEEEQVMAVLPAYLKPIVRVALLTGMRQGEVLALQWSDVDFDQMIVRVVRTKSHRTRYIPMNRTLVETLRALQSPQSESTGFVFANPETKTRYEDVRHRFGDLCRKAKLQDVTFHTLRHTFASRLAQAGVPLTRSASFWATDRCR